MSASLSRQGAELRLCGRLDFAAADAVCAQGQALIATMTGDVVVDLAGLEAPGSVGVAVLLRWARQLAARGDRLRLAHMPARVRAIIAVSGLQEALPDAPA